MINQTTTTEQELNEKLLKFAGIIWSNEYQSWLYPDGGYSDAPNFPHSLDACLEYLGPKFGVKSLQFYHHYNPDLGQSVWEWVVRLVTAPTSPGRDEYSAWGSNPALAFCRSVEVAIDRGAKF